MQARQPTYFEALLNRLRQPTADLLQEHSDLDPFAALIALILQTEARTERPIRELLLDERFLKAGRAYAALLLENDRLPPGEQLSPEELSLPRALLLEFFRGGRDIQLRAQEVLTLIERKFSQRCFQQANILLQLFETDAATRLQNERKLFYEDMIQRLGIRRRQPLDPGDSSAVQEHFAALKRELHDAGAFLRRDADTLSLQRLAAPLTPWDTHAHPGDDLTPLTLEDPFLPLLRAFDWLAARHQVHFCLLTRDADDFNAWSRLAAGRHDAELLRFIPPSRWRSPANLTATPLLQQLAAALHEQALRAWMQSTTRAAYFILLAVGDTGLENFLDAYFDWLKEDLGVDGTAFIDRLHRESTLGELTLEETLNAIFDEHFAKPLEEKPRDLSVHQLRRALALFTDALPQINFSEVPPGHYNLAGFLLDHLLNLKYPSPEFPFKMHRIS